MEDTLLPTAEEELQTNYAACLKQDRKPPNMACTGFSGKAKNRGLLPAVQVAVAPQMMTSAKPIMQGWSDYWKQTTEAAL